MFNVYEFEKRQKTQEQSRRDEKKKLRDISRLKQKNAELGDAYRNRVGKFIKNMLQEPMMINDELGIRMSQQSSGAFTIEEM